MIRRGFSITLLILSGLVTACGQGSASPSSSPSASKSAGPPTVPPTPAPPTPTPLPALNVEQGVVLVRNGVPGPQTAAAPGLGVVQTTEGVVYTLGPGGQNVHNLIPLVGDPAANGIAATLTWRYPNPAEPTMSASSSSDASVGAYCALADQSVLYSITVGAWGGRVRVIRSEAVPNAGDTSDGVRPLDPPPLITLAPPPKLNTMTVACVTLSPTTVRLVVEMNGQRVFDVIDVPPARHRLGAWYSGLELDRESLDVNNATVVVSSIEVRRLA